MMREWTNVWRLIEYKIRQQQIPTGYTKQPKTKEIASQILLTRLHFCRCPCVPLGNVTVEHFSRLKHCTTKQTNNQDIRYKIINHNKIHHQNEQLDRYDLWLTVQHEFYLPHVPLGDITIECPSFMEHYSRHPNRTHKERGKKWQIR